MTAASPKRTAAEWAAGVAVAVAVGWVLVWVVHKVSALGNGLDPDADAYCEAEVLRAAEGYATLGFTSNWGLPDNCFGNQFPQEGSKRLFHPSNRKWHQTWEQGTLSGRSDKHAISVDHFVYTHLPQGPYWVAGVLTAALGPGRVGEYRAAPVAASLAGLLVLTRGAAAAVGPVRAALLVLAAVAVPMYRTMMHGLAFQPYSHALLLAEIGLFLPALRTGTLTQPAAAGLAVVGFLAGWQCFEYSFVTAFTPAALWLVRVGGGPRPGWRAVAAACVAAGGGFTAAHTLHFAEVAGYLGGVGAAVTDFTTAAKYRGGAMLYDSGADRHDLSTVVGRYLFVYTGNPGQLGVPVAWVALAGTVVLAGLAVAGRGPDVLAVAAPAAAVGVALIWVLVMTQYSAQHNHYIPRLFFLPYFVTVLAVVEAGRPPTPAAGSPATGP